MQKTCELCGKQFEARSSRQYKCKNDHYLKCPSCGVDVLWNNRLRLFKGCKACNYKRAIELRKATMLKRYGGETTLQSKQLTDKLKATCVERYGAASPMKSDIVQKRYKATCIKKYGVANPMSNPEIAKKSGQTRKQNMDEIVNNIRKSFQEKYGYDSCFQSPEIIKKIDDTFIRKYGVRRAIQVPEFRQKMQNTMNDRYGVPYYVLTDEYRQGTSSHNSQANVQFQEFLESNNISVIPEFRIDMKCYNFRVVDHNILIELNPTYTHNIIGNHWNKCGVDVNYHNDKSILAETNGYRCIHVWDWDDWNKILPLLQLHNKKIYARNCQVYKLNKNVGDEFLAAYHLQGTCKGQLLYLGLVNDGELVQVMTFGKPRFNHNYDIELLRLCTKPDITVIGGASKLFNFAVTQYELDNIISYCDRSKFNGDVYTKMGMVLHHITEPQEIWSKSQERITANLLRQRGYDQLFNTDYGKGTSNEQLMLDHGWLPIYDCGQNVYEYKKQDSYAYTTDKNNYNATKIQRMTEPREKLCAFCNEPFIPNSNNQKYCKRPHYRMCPVCHNQYLEDNVENLKRPPIACSNRCRIQKIQLAKQRQN